MVSIVQVCLLFSTVSILCRIYIDKFVVSDTFVTLHVLLSSLKTLTSVIQTITSVTTMPCVTTQWAPTIVLAIVVMKEMALIVQVCLLFSTVSISCRIYIDSSSLVVAHLYPYLYNYFLLRH